MKTNWRSEFFVASAISFAVVSLLSTANLLLDARKSDLNGGTMAPMILKSSHEVLESSLRTTERDFPVDRLIATPAYQEHVARLTAFAKTLESDNKVEDQKAAILSVIFIITGFSYLIAKILIKKNSTTESEETSKASRVKALSL